VSVLFHAGGIDEICFHLFTWRRSRLHLGRFKEPIYYLTDPISWKPNPGQENGFKRVEAPKGFVSDLADIKFILNELLCGNFARNLTNVSTWGNVR
jgi:hypothetical protein